MEAGVIRSEIAGGVYRGGAKREVLGVQREYEERWMRIAEGERKVKDEEERRQNCWKSEQERVEVR